METVTDVKTVLDANHFDKRVQEDSKRLYAFLLCTDEHEEFRTYIEKAWRTLHRLSGDSCDIFTLEQPPWRRNFESTLYLPIEGGVKGPARVAPGSEFGYRDFEIAVDNGIMLPERAECFKVRDALFEDPVKVVLPGVAIFPSVLAKRARYYKCGDLTSNKLSELFQRVLTTISQEYNGRRNSEEIFEAFQVSERVHALKKYAIDALLKLSLLDLFKALTSGIQIVLPK